MTLHEGLARVIEDARDHSRKNFNVVKESYGQYLARAILTSDVIAKVRAEEREKADQEPSDAAVEAAARAMAHADVTNPDGWVMTEEARNVYSDMARAALIAAQEVRDES